MLHLLLSLNVFVPGLFLFCQELFIDKFLLELLLLFDGLNHFAHLGCLKVVASFDVFLLSVKFVLDDLDISFKFFLQTSETTLL
jgi:hypothetical protein